MPIKMQVNKRRILYTVCFFFLCLIDQRIKTGSGLDGVIESFRSLTGVIVAILILSHNTGEHIRRELAKRKLPYLLWSLVACIGGGLYITSGASITYFLNHRIVNAVNVLLYGIILLQHFFTYVVDKQRFVINRFYGCVWLVMMGLMCVSRNGSHWPAIYLILFGCFYLTDYSAKEREDLFQGMLNGIILGFFILQGWCFAFRPYDAVRYVGVYNNSNLNALFYLMVLAAVLAKLIIASGKEKHIFEKLFFLLGTGTLLGFLFMTIGRTAWMAAAILVFVALLFWTKADTKGKWMLGFVKNGAAIVLCFVLLFPVVFGAVRYLPPMFHHPVWFYGEWAESKVHSWDKADSPKFVNLDKLMKTANGRVALLIESALGTKTEQGGAQSNSQPEADQGISEIQQQLYDEAYAAGYAIDPKDKKDAVLVRGAIYRYYFHLLNWTGHPESEQGFQIIPTHRIGHAHNIYLQWGVDFGIPAMCLFIILLFGMFRSLIAEYRKSKSVCAAGIILIGMVPCLFGMLEYAWGFGSLTITILFVIWRRIICNEFEKRS